MDTRSFDAGGVPATARLVVRQSVPAPNNRNTGIAGRRPSRPAPARYAIARTARDVLWPWLRNVGPSWQARASRAASAIYEEPQTAVGVPKASSARGTG